MVDVGSTFNINVKPIIVSDFFAYKLLSKKKKKKNRDNF